MPSDLNFGDWQQLLSNFGGRAYAFGEVSNIQTDTPSAGQSTITVTPLRMRPDQWIGAGFVILSRDANGFTLWWEIVDNTESQIVIEPADDHYALGGISVGNSFAIVDLNAISAALTGGSATTNSNSTITGRDGETVDLASNEDISGGVQGPVSNWNRWTLYLNTGGAMDITIELSPDDGATWYEISESPVNFSSAGDQTFQIGYDATDIRLTGSDSTAVTAQIRGMY